MKTTFSRKWKASKQPRKQRKFKANALLHMKGAFSSSRLSKPLSAQHISRNLVLRKGDKVKVLRGSFKGREGQVARVERKHERAFIEGIEVKKRNGTVAQPSIHPSNLLIVALAGGDKKRLRGKKENESTP